MNLAVKRIVRALLVCLAWPICSPAIGAGAPPACSVVATGLNFGIYRATAGPVAFTGTIHVLCSGGPAMFTVALTGGSSGSVTTRQMRASDGAVLRYQLYLDAARTQPWGDGASGRVAGPITGTAATLTVYGLLFSGQHVPAGQVTDTVQAILNY
jgi:spore coat protein U-like protein